MERAAVLPTPATTPTSSPVDYSTPPHISEPAMDPDDFAVNPAYLLQVDLFDAINTHPQPPAAVLPVSKALSKQTPRN
jgi:hypothetical protein